MEVTWIKEHAVKRNYLLENNDINNCNESTLGLLLIYNGCIFPRKNQTLEGIIISHFIYADNRDIQHE